MPPRRLALSRRHSPLVVAGRACACALRTRAWSTVGAHGAFCPAAAPQPRVRRRSAPDYRLRGPGPSQGRPLALICGKGASETRRDARA